MTSEELTEKLKAELPDVLARDLVDQFMLIRRDVATITLERSSPGKFVETVVQVLQHFERQSFDQAPKVDDYLKNLESRQTSLPDDLRLIVSRVARSMYTLRSKRGVVHKGVIDPAVSDLRYVYTSAQWVLSEIVRHISGEDVETANHLVEFVQLPIDPLVEDFGDRRLVMFAQTAKEELLVLLRHYYPDATTVLQIRRDMDRRKPSTVLFAIRSAWEQRLIEGDKTKGYKLTQTGFRSAAELIRERLSNPVVRDRRQAAPPTQTGCR